MFTSAWSVRPCFSRDSMAVSSGRVAQGGQGERVVLAPLAKHGRVGRRQVEGTQKHDAPRGASSAKVLGCQKQLRQLIHTVRSRPASSTTTNTHHQDAKRSALTWRPNAEVSQGRRCGHSRPHVQSTLSHACAGSVCGQPCSPMARTKRRSNRRRTRVHPATNSIHKNDSDVQTYVRLLTFERVSSYMFRQVSFCWSCVLCCTR